MKELNTLLITLSIFISLGQPPFEADNEDELFDSILHDDVLYPVWLTKEAVSILKGVSILRTSTSVLLDVPDPPVTVHDQELGQKIRLRRDSRRWKGHSGSSLLPWHWLDRFGAEKGPAAIQAKDCKSILSLFRNCLKVVSFQKTKRDVNNFDSDFTKEEPSLTPVAAEILKTIDQKEFAGFSFVNEDFIPNRFASDTTVTWKVVAVVVVAYWWLVCIRCSSEQDSFRFCYRHL